MYSLNGILLITLIALGIFVTLITIWFQGRRKKRRHFNHLSFQFEKQPKDFTASTHFDESIGPVRVRQDDPDQTTSTEETSEDSSLPPQSQNNTSHWPTTLSLYIKAKPHEFFYGYGLMQAILNHGFVHGSMQFFHYGDTHKTLFSLTSLDPPGGFNLDKMGAFKTSGLCLFMQPQRLQQATLVLEQMVSLGQQIAEDLGGIIEDEHHHLLTPERLNYWRSTLSETPNES